MTDSAKYVYAIAGEGLSRAHGIRGLDGASVYAISEGSLAAIVSDVVGKRVRPERAKLTAHHAVIARLMEEDTVLPMTFGTIATSKELVNVLRTNKKVFGRRLDHVKGRVEMGLRVTWDMPNIFEFFVSRHSSLMALRDDLYLRRRQQPTRDEKIALGSLFDQLLVQERQAHADAVMKVLRPHCIEIKQNKPRGEQEIMRLACLIDRPDQKCFEDAVFQAAHLFDDNYSFSFNGPWSPYNFVDGLRFDQQGAL